MSKAKSIENLVNSSQKKVYVFLSDEETVTRFITDAETEGYTFGDGIKLSERGSSDIYALNRDKTVNYVSFIGRIAFQCNAERIVRVDYKKYINGNKNYYIHKATAISEKKSDKLSIV